MSSAFIFTAVHCVYILFNDSKAKKEQTIKNHGIEELEQWKEVVLFFSWDEGNKKIKVCSSNGDIRVNQIQNNKATE